MHRLKGKVAIVTGSSSGIGKAIALRFGAEGANVVVTARRIALCDQTSYRSQRTAGRPMQTHWRLKPGGTTYRETVERYGAGHSREHAASCGWAVAEYDDERVREVMNVNLRGTFFCCRAGFKQMKKQGEGIIINMSSVAGVQAWAGTGTYSASKHGIMALTKSLADEGRPHHIRVSAICPGGVADDLVDASPEEILRSEKIDPFDVAETALYLATLGKYSVVHQVVIDRLGADW